MSDQPTQDETEFPTHCDVCGTELETGIVGIDESDIGNEPLPATTVFEAFCPNRECPAHKPQAHPAVQPPGSAAG
jgi:NAD-dependent DNA ligase